MPSYSKAIVLSLIFGMTSGSCRHHPRPPHHASSTAVAAVGQSSTPSTDTTESYTATEATPTATKTKVATSTPSTGSNSGSSVPAGFEPGVKWQIAIQDPVDPRGGLQPADAKVLDVDLFLASKDPTLIPALHVSCARNRFLFLSPLNYFTDVYCI